MLFQLHEPDVVLERDSVGTSSCFLMFVFIVEADDSAAEGRRARLQQRPPARTGPLVGGGLVGDGFLVDPSCWRCLKEDDRWSQQLK